MELLRKELDTLVVLIGGWLCTCVCVWGGGALDIHSSWVLKSITQSLLGVANIREWGSSYTLVSYPGLHTKDESHTDISPL